MNNHQRGPRLAAVLLLAAIFLSACQQSVSNAPLATPTLITPTGLFVTPLSGENPMQMIEEFAQGTAAAQTAAAGGATPGTTPLVVATIGTETTPQVGTPATPTTGIVVNTTPVVAATTPVTPIVSTVAVVGTPGVVPTAGPKPASYTLQKGEWPYCIARRYNVNPVELLSLSGLTTAQSEMLMPGQVLTIPQGSGVFPADRALHTHPATYTVPSADTTLYAVACYFGDLSPEQIAAYNGISLSSRLQSGQTLNIP